MAVYNITQDQVKRLFDYDDSGNLIWKIRPNSKVSIGDIVGTLNKKIGYLYTRVSGHIIAVHRIIFLWHYGYLPENDIDHIDKNRLNNKIENLREISRVCNSRNCNVSKNNKSGISGVSYNTKRDRYCVSITVNYKQYSIGSITDFDEAVCLRLAIEQCLNWNNCDNSSSAAIYVKKHIQGHLK